MPGEPMTHAIEKALRQAMVRAKEDGPIFEAVAYALHKFVKSGHSLEELPCSQYVVAARQARHKAAA